MNEILRQWCNYKNISINNIECRLYDDWPEDYLICFIRKENAFTAICSNQDDFDIIIEGESILVPLFIETNINKRVDHAVQNALINGCENVIITLIKIKNVHNKYGLIITDYLTEPSTLCLSSIRNKYLKMNGYSTQENFYYDRHNLYEQRDH